MSEPNETFDQWCIVEVMGHQRYVGRVTEQVIAGTGFVRVDIPKTEETQAWTNLWASGRRRTGCSVFTCQTTSKAFYAFLQAVASTFPSR